MECLRENVVHCVFNLQPYLSSNHPPLPPTTVSSWTNVSGNHKDSWKCPGLDTEKEVQTKSVQSRLIWPCDTAGHCQKETLLMFKCGHAYQEGRHLPFQQIPKVGSIFTVTLLLCFLYFLLPCPSTLMEKAVAPTPALLPGESHGWRSLEGCSPWGPWGSDTTDRLHFHFSLSYIGEGNGNPLHCSCLENPGDGGAWWAAVYGIAESDTT